MSNIVKFKGEIIKRLPNSMFLVYFSLISRKIVCYLCGKLRLKYIKLLVGDIVVVEFDKSNLFKGRIINYINESKSVS